MEQSLKAMVVGLLWVSCGPVNAMPVWNGELALEYPVAEWTFTSTNRTTVTSSNLQALVSSTSSGIIETSHTNGIRYVRVQIEKGVLTGVCQFWHPNGVLARFGWLDADRPAGDWVWWDANRRVIGKHSYGNTGCRTGTWVHWNAETEPGFILNLSSYNRGKLEGPVFWFGEQGEVREQERHIWGERASITNAATVHK